MDQKYLEYYNAQSGRGLQFNEDFGSLINTPKLLQRGRGLGGVFSSLFRYIKPLLYSGLNYFKDEALDAGSQFLSGKNPNDILREKGLAAVEKLRDKAAEKIQKMTGSGLESQSRSRVCKTHSSIKKPCCNKNRIKRSSSKNNPHSQSALRAVGAKRKKFNDIFE